MPGGLCYRWLRRETDDKVYEKGDERSVKEKSRGKNETKTLWLFRTGGVTEKTMAHLRSRLPELFGVRLAEEEAFELERTEYVERRGQYDALRILARLRGLKPPADLLLAVTESDLCIDGMNFVFGVADPDQGCAVISLARLGIGFPGPAVTRELLLRRTLIEAVHELGHLQGLGHCTNRSCVMHFSNCLLDTDRKGPEFCRRCEALRLSG
jgi:archaemetzincin